MNKAEPAEPIEPAEPVETGMTVSKDDEPAQEDLEQQNLRREIDKWLLQHFNVTVESPSKISENV